MSTWVSASDRWRRVLDGQRASGLSVAEFCRQARVPASSFFYWRRKLGAAGAPRRPGAAFAEVKVVPEPAGVSSGTGTPLSSGIEVLLPCGLCVVVRAGFDRRTLLDLLAALEARDEAAPPVFGASGVEGAALSRASEAGA